MTWHVVVWLAVTGMATWALMHNLSLKRVVGSSMEPAIQHGDVILVRRRRKAEIPPVGQIVAITRPMGLYIKRIAELQPPPGHQTTAEVHAWVLGDNCDFSDDSRQFGAVSLDSVEGIVLGIVAFRQRRGHMSVRENSKMQG